MWNPENEGELIPLGAIGMEILEPKQEVLEEKAN